MTDIQDVPFPNNWRHVTGLENRMPICAYFDVAREQRRVLDVDDLSPDEYTYITLYVS